MEVALTSAAAREVTQGVIPHVEREIGYLVHFKRNVKNLQIKIDQLSATRNIVLRLIDAAMNNNQLIRESVLTWLARAEIVGDEAAKLNDKSGQINSCFKGWCCSRFSIGRKAQKKYAAIQELLDERILFGDVVSDPKLIQNLEITSNGDFDAFASRDTTARKIVDLMIDCDIHVVGVYGMPGVGKTMLMDVLSKKVKIMKLFDEVVMVIVSQNSNLEKIQGDVAKGLDLKFEESDTSYIKKAKLFGRLSQDKNTLIIMDDVWERLELVEVGIPNNQRCKVVFTTRDRGVCSRMECDETGTIEVKVLSEDDSWLLFQKRAGDVVNSIPPELAKGIANECKGLPLALATIGRALRNKDETVWENALLQLRRSIFRGMTPVVSSIKLSYTFLPDREISMCFLTCCLFPEDYKIYTDTLLCYLMCGKLLSDVDTLLEAKIKLHAILDELVSSCLLLKDEEGYIMMHDVVRDAAISIGCEEGNGFIVKAGMELANWPNLDMENCVRLSLMSTNIRCVLPNQIRAPCLLTLSLNDSKDLKEIPTNFFKEMKALVTLDLSQTAITSLPPSFSCLENLQTLLMEKCYNLDNISQIEGLMRLEIVSLSGCYKLNFSKELGELTNLKMLDLFCNGYAFRKFPPKVISSLYQLEKLNILGLMIKGNEVANLTEIACLTRLASLCIYLNGLCLSQDIPHHFKNLTEFRIVAMAKISIDSSYEQFLVDRMKYKRSMYLDISPIPVAAWVLALLERTIYLFLHTCHNLESVVQLDPRGLIYNNWKVLHVRNCHQLKYLATVGAKNALGFAFNNLEELYFRDMDSLETICDGTLPQGFLHKLRVLHLTYCKLVNNLVTWDQSNAFSVYPPSPIFANLRELQIYRCDNLTSVFPMRVVRDLSQLEQLDISFCSYMETIVKNCENHGYSEQDKSVLPRLEILRLLYLPRLLSFNIPALPFDFPAMVELKVSGCLKLKLLPLSANSAPKLEQINVREKDWFESLEWEDQKLKSRMDSLMKV